MNYKERKIIIVTEKSDLDKIVEFVRTNENKIIKKEFLNDQLEIFSQFAFDLEEGSIVGAIEHDTGNLLVTGKVLIR